MRHLRLCARLPPVLSRWYGQPRSRSQGVVSECEARVDQGQKLLLHRVGCRCGRERVPSLSGLRPASLSSVPVLCLCKHRWSPTLPLYAHTAQNGSKGGSCRLQPQSKARGPSWGVSPASSNLAQRGVLASCSGPLHVSRERCFMQRSRHCLYLARMYWYHWGGTKGWMRLSWRNFETKT